MRFSELQQRMRRRPLFSFDDLHATAPPTRAERVQLSLWAREGKVIRLRRGLYTLGPEFRDASPSALEVAEPLYRPSYVSLEYALSHYGLIPDAAQAVTCVTTLKTARFENPLGRFEYRHVDPCYFFGFERVEKPVVHWLAWPEKALLDFIYLRVPKKEPLSPGVFREGYRLQNLDQLRSGRLRDLLRRFSHPRVQQGGRLLLDLVKEDRSHD
jgi:predicted transcriptional regulator of viral defense system